MKHHLLLIAIFGSLISAAQTVNTPYSGNGLGNIEFQGMPSNIAMGEIGIGTPQNWHINSQNPAWLVYNTFSSFQLGLMGDSRTFNRSDASNKSLSFSLRSMAVAFPMASKGRWVSSFSLLPYSTVKYNTFSFDSINTTRATSAQNGDGGITDLTWSHGIKLYKTLSLGIKASYLFGEIRDRSTIILESPDFSFPFSISYNELTNYSGFNLGGALGYQVKLSDERLFNVGMVYQQSGEINGDRTLSYIRTSFTGFEASEEISSDNSKFEIPSQLGFGFSFEKINKLKIGIDYEQQDWSKSSSEGPSETFQKKYRIALGGELTPDYQSVNSYFKRATYRAGLNFAELPYIVNNTKIRDFGINFGASFPMSGLSSLDFAAKVGVRGTTKNDLIRENYFQIVIGATINDRWFIKRRYD